MNFKNENWEKKVTEGKKIGKIKSRILEITYIGGKIIKNSNIIANVKCRIIVSWKGQ